MNQSEMRDIAKIYATSIVTTPSEKQDEALKKAIEEIIKKYPQNHAKMLELLRSQIGVVGKTTQGDNSQLLKLLERINKIREDSNDNSNNQAQNDDNK